MIINNSKLLRVRFTVFVANERILEMERKSERNMKRMKEKERE